MCETAAKRVAERVSGVVVTLHHCRIEDKPHEWYRQFHIIVLGLDSLEARSYMNAVACSFLRHDADGAVDQSTIKPMVDGGTEGFKGHARVILPGVTPCFECTMWLFPPSRISPVHVGGDAEERGALRGVREVDSMAQERPDDAFDADDPEHLRWVFEAAAQRADTFDIPGVTYTHAQGVVKNIIPAIPSTNAVVAAACAVETLKMATMCSTGMDNYSLYVGTSGCTRTRWRTRETRSVRCVRPGSG